MKKMEKELKDTIILIWFTSGLSLAMATLIKQEFWFPIWFSSIVLFIFGDLFYQIIKGRKKPKKKIKVSKSYKKKIPVPKKVTFKLKDGRKVTFKARR